MEHQLNIFHGKADTSNDQGKQKALDELFEQSAKYRQSAEYFKLLNFIRRFRNLSPFNAFLIHMQDSAANVVLTANNWAKQYGRKVNPMARPFIILVPFGPVEFVYDVSDTEPINGDKDYVPKELMQPFFTKGDLPSSIFHNTIKNARKEGIDYYEQKMQGGGAGYATTMQNEWFKVIVNSGYPINEKYSTLVHELAHIYCGHVGKYRENWWDSRKGNINKDIEEIEAESVAYLVCLRHGLTTTSQEYLSSYIEENKPLPNISLETILTVANHIEKMGLQGFKPKKK